MFAKTTPEPSSLDNAIERLHKEMRETYPTTDDYAKFVDQLIKLQTLKDNSSPQRLSADAKATLFANLAGILLILNHERAGIVTSKALSFVSKLR